MLGFVLGAILAAWSGKFWTAWPRYNAISLPDRFGTGTAVMLILAACGVLYGLADRLERGRYGQVVSLRIPAEPGRVSLAVGAVGLTVVGFAALVVADRPWTITAAFSLWGSKLIEWSGVDDPVFWPYWADATRVEAFLRPLAADVTTVMDFGLIVGACLVSVMTRRPSSVREHGQSLGPLVVALLGGVAMGAGATMAPGCNISGLLAGIASGSLHGWVWFALAFCGSAIGVHVRGSLGLA